MTLQIARLTALAALTLAAYTPMLVSAQSASPAPKPKISIAPRTIHKAKYKQDTMIKRSQRHPEATSGTSASGENPESPAPNPMMSPH